MKKIKERKKEKKKGSRKEREKIRRGTVMSRSFFMPKFTLGQFSILKMNIKIYTKERKYGKRSYIPWQ